MVQIIHGYPYTFEEKYNQQIILDPLTSCLTTLSIQNAYTFVICVPSFMWCYSFSFSFCDIENINLKQFRKARDT